MKHITYIHLFLILTYCGQSKSEQQTAAVSDTVYTNNEISVQQKPIEEKPNEEDFREQSLSGFKKEKLYKLTDTITVDFNGDEIIDKAFYKKDNGTSGIIIVHGKTNEEIRIGFGKSFAHMTEFDWVDYWKIVEDKETYETTFKDDGDVLGNKKLRLQNTSIFVGAHEEGGGLITFKNGKYVWIHQAD